MENKIRNLTQYRLKVERNGKSVVDMPGLLCLPGLLAAPRLSIAGMVVAPLLGYNIHLENEEGAEVNLEDTVRKAADTAIETATSAAKAIKEEIEKAFQTVSDDPADAEETEVSPEAEEESAAAEASNEEIVEDLEKQVKEDDVPTIQVNPDESAEG